MLRWWQFRRFRNADNGAGGGDGGSGGGQSGAAGGTGGSGTGGDGAKGGAGGILSGGAGGAGGQGGQQGAQNAGGGGDGQQQQQQQGGNAWLLNEGVPGTGDRPAWFKGDKYKSVADQAAALPGLEAKLGPAAQFFGAPENGQYQAPKMPEGLEGSFDTEAPLFKSFAEFAKKEGISQAGFEKLAQFYAQVEAQEAQAEEARVSEAIAKLGSNLPQRLEAIQAYVEQHVGKDGFTALDAAIGGNLEAFQALEKLISVAANDARLAGSGGATGVGFSRQDVEAKRYAKVESGPNAGQYRYDVDSAYREEVDGMWKKLYPGESNQVQVG